MAQSRSDPHSFSASGWLRLRRSTPEGMNRSIRFAREGVIKIRVLEDEAGICWCGEWDLYLARGGSKDGNSEDGGSV